LRAGVRLVMSRAASQLGTFSAPSRIILRDAIFSIAVDPQKFHCWDRKARENSLGNASADSRYGKKRERLRKRIRFKNSGSPG